MIMLCHGARYVMLCCNYQIYYVIEYHVDTLCHVNLCYVMESVIHYITK